MEKVTWRKLSKIRSEFFFQQVPYVRLVARPNRLLAINVPPRK